jgi:hypothetical protein
MVKKVAESGGIIYARYGHNNGGIHKKMTTPKYFGVVICDLRNS